MRHYESFILGVIAVFIALVLQVSLTIFGKSSDTSSFVDFTYTTTGLSVIFAITVAALLEEIVRVSILYAYARKHHFPDSWWVYGASFGCAFGLTEILLSSMRDGSPAYSVGLIGIFCFHIVASVLAVKFLQYFRILSFLLTILFLTILHVSYNIFVLFVVPFFIS